MDLSLPSLNLAFQSVKANHGCAGVDRVTIGKFERKLEGNLKSLQYELLEGIYSPLPLMKIFVEKKNGEARGLSVPIVRDRVVQKAILQIIEPILDKEFEVCSYAYRKEHSVKQAVMKIKEFHEHGYCWVVDADIDAYFDSVNHDLLMEKIDRFIRNKDIRNLLYLWIKAEVWDGHALQKLEKGIPQGSAVSPILANLFLDELDEVMLQKGYKYVRYADDYVILCKTPDEASTALELSKKILAKLDLELDDEEIKSFEDGFKYLGVIFLNDMIMKPFEEHKKKSKVLSYPALFDLEGYLSSRNRKLVI